MLQKIIALISVATLCLISGCIDKPEEVVSVSTESQEESTINACRVEFSFEEESSSAEYEEESSSEEESESETPHFLYCVDEYVYVKDGVDFKREPDENSENVGFLNYTERVHKLEIYSDGWVKAETGGIIGFCKEDILTKPIKDDPFN